LALNSRGEESTATGTRTARAISLQKEQAAALEQAEETLRGSQKMEALGQLSDGIAQDFNSVLTGISGSLELLQSRIKQGRFNDLERYIAAAQEASKRAAALTHRLYRHKDGALRWISWHTSVESGLVYGNGRHISLKGASCGTRMLASGFCLAMTDAHQLENAILNLAINARDAMPRWWPTYD
jgi:C4-dicarboxylate-specific signal transduction histidine kinase